MEVSGRTEPSGGPRKHTAVCQPCCNDGQDVEAEGFCENCKEYLCKTCIKYHQKLTLSKNHVILDKHNMPTDEHQGATPICSELCEKHTTEIVKFFCKKHDKIGCGDCMVLEHKSCKIDYIHDIADAFLGGSEYKAIMQEVNQVQLSVMSTNEKIVNSELEAGTSCSRSMDEIRTFRKEINAYLDKMEKQLLENCSKIKKANDKVIETTKGDIKRIVKKLDTIHSQLTSKTEPSTDMFVKARKARLALKALQDEMFDVEKNFKPKICHFRRNTDIDEVVSQDKSLGDICSDVVSIQVDPREKRNMVNAVLKRGKNIDLEEKSIISSIIALNDVTLACSDWNKNKVKLIDVTSGTLSSEIKVEPWPWDVTMLPGDEFAVTLTTSQKIQVISFKQGLSNVRAINVNGECRGITYSNNRLVVSYEKDPKVEVLTLQGDVINIIKTDIMVGSALLKYPLYVACSADGKIIFVSDSRANSVTKFSFDGRVLASYRDPDLKDPRQLVVCEDDSILVCSSVTSVVQLLSPELRKTKNILRRQDGVDEFMAMYLDRNTDKLFLSNFKRRNEIQVYNITYRM